MLQSVTLKNFRGLAQLAVELSPVTVFLGPNSCGKTTILQAVQLACNALDLALSRGAPNSAIFPDKQQIRVFGDLPLRDDEALLPTRRWRELFYGRNLDEEIEITLGFSESTFIQQIRVRIKAGRAEALRMTIDVTSRRACELVGGRKRDAVSPLLPHLQDHAPRALLTRSLSGVVRDEEYRSRRIVTDLLPAGEGSQVVRNLLLRLRDREQANEFLSDLRMPAKLQVPKERPEWEQVRHLEVYFRDEDGWLELAAAGSGLVSLLSLFGAAELHLSAARTAGPKLLLLDEPEAHLHPRKQAELVLPLRNYARDRNLQLLLATHSVELIEQCSRLPDTSLVRISRQDQRATVLTTDQERLSELQSFCDLSAFASLQFLAHRRIVFHEGKEDRQILEALAELRFRGDATKRERFKLWSFAPLAGVDNAAAKDILHRAMVPLFKLDELRKAPLRVVRVLDSDGRRPVGTVDSKAEGYEQRELVWSRHSIESLFLDASCLSAWLFEALSERAEHINRARSGEPALPQLEVPTQATIAPWVTAALAAADGDQGLRDEVLVQLQVELAGGRSVEDLREGYRRASAAYDAEPGRYQRGHSRAQFVLAQIRRRLAGDERQQPIANAVPHDVAALVVRSPLRRTSRVTAAELFPQEIASLLEYMAA